MELGSVIIPYFRKKKYITETISSVLRQTYENLEVIKVYDDETKVDLDFINNLKNKDSRIKIITNSLKEISNKSFLIKSEKNKYDPTVKR